MSAHWTENRDGLWWNIETRDANGLGGNTLRIGFEKSTRESLRFDCFRRAPHWHLDPGGMNETHSLDERGDPVSEVMSILDADLPELLARASAKDEPPTSDAPSAQSVPAQAADIAGQSAFQQPDGAAFRLTLETALRHRPVFLDEIDRVQLESRRSEKWHTYPPDVLPAWVAEMDFPVAAPIQDELRRFSEQMDLGYPIGLRETGLAETFADRMNESFGWMPDPNRVEILSEVVQGMYVALESFTQPKAGVVVQTPIYPPFIGSVRDTGRRLIENRLVPGDARFEIDFDQLEASVDGDTELFMFCNPHNPTGRVFDRTELERLAEWVLRHDLVVLSDEIHGDLVFDPRRHLPMASVSPEIAARTVTLTSPSKAFNIPGLRCAVAHFGSEALQHRFNTALPRHARGGIGLLGLYCSNAAWRFGQPWLETVRPYLEANRDFVQETLAKRIPEIRILPAEATYLAWLDTSALEIAGSPAAHFLREGRVALSDGRAFGEGFERYVRLNFATSRPILTEVIERMTSALGR